MCLCVLRGTQQCTNGKTELTSGRYVYMCPTFAWIRVGTPTLINYPLLRAQPSSLSWGVLCLELVLHFQGRVHKVCCSSLVFSALVAQSAGGQLMQSATFCTHPNKREIAIETTGIHRKGSKKKCAFDNRWNSIVSGTICTSNGAISLRDNDLQKSQKTTTKCAKLSTWTIF